MKSVKNIYKQVKNNFNAFLEKGGKYLDEHPVFYTSLITAQATTFNGINIYELSHRSKNELELFFYMATYILFMESYRYAVGDYKEKRRTFNNEKTTSGIKGFVEKGYLSCINMLLEGAGALTSIYGIYKYFESLIK